MVSGLPDHYRGVDVAYQALAQMIVRQKYGGADLVAGQKVITPSTYDLLLTVDGKGVIYGGLLWLDYTFSQANDEVVLVVDGTILTGLSHLRLSTYGVDKPGAYPVFINKYDGVNFIYSVGLGFGLTFETQVKLYYNETYGRDPTVFYRLMYALV